VTYYELSNHLGNVLVTVTDMKVGIDDDGDWVAEYYEATVVSAVDYYPFGSAMAGRKYNQGTYRYGFNGKEEDKEWGSQMIQDYGFRIYNPTIGKFLSVDPLAPDYPWYTPYQFAGNMPIWATDLDGLEPEKKNSQGNYTEYRVKADQGPTQIAMDLQGNYGQNTHWLAIVLANPQVFATKANIKNIFDKTDPGYKAMNINVNDVLKLPSEELVELVKQYNAGPPEAASFDNLLSFFVDQDYELIKNKGFYKIFGGPYDTEIKVNTYDLERAKKHFLYPWMEKNKNGEDWFWNAPEGVVMLPPIENMEKITPNGHVTGLPNIGDLSDGEHEVEGQVIKKVESIKFRVFGKGDTTIINSTTRNDTTKGTIIYNVETKPNGGGTVTSHDKGKVKKSGQ
jgi:RHS repeat-associated protein